MAKRIQTLGGFQGSLMASREAMKISTLTNKKTNDGSALGYLGARLGIGAAGIFEGFGDFVSGSIYQLTGDRDYAKYLHDRDITGGWQQKVDADYNPSGAMRIAGDIASGLGQALPSLGVGIATGGVGTAAQVAGSVGIGMGYAGRGVTAAVQKTGQLGAKENIYGIASGALEGATDALLGGVQKAGKSLWTVGKSATRLSAGKIARNGLMKGMLSAAGSEAAEEFIQEYADAALLRVTGVDKNASVSFQDAMYSAMIGGITGGFLGGATGSLNAVRNIQRGNSIRARNLEGSLLATANYIRNDYLGKEANFQNIDSPALRTLSAAVDAYEKLAKDGKTDGNRGAMLLGEIQMGTLAFETDVGVRQRMSAIMANPTEEWARYASMAAGKTVTVDDLRQNKDGVTELLAVRAFAGDLMAESGTERVARMVWEKIRDERYVPVSEAKSWDGNVPADGSVVFRTGDGRFVIVTAGTEEGRYRVGFTETADYDEKDLRVVQEDVAADTVRGALSGLADGSLVLSENGFVSTGNAAVSSEAAKKAPVQGEAVVDKEENAKTGKMAPVGEKSSMRRALTAEYEKRIDAWDQKTEGFSFVVGDTSSAIKNIEVDGKPVGVKQVRIDATKIKKILADHSEMNIDIIKQLPHVINDPVLVLDSKTMEGRLVLLGEVYAANGTPVRVVLELNPSTRNRRSNKVYANITKIATAFGQGNLQNLINTSKIRRINKGRIDDWLKVNRLQLPLPNSQSDPATTSIPQKPKKSTVSEKKDAERGSIAAYGNDSRRSALKKEGERKDPKTRKYLPQKATGEKESRKQKKQRKKAEAMAYSLAAARNSQATQKKTEVDEVIISRGYSDKEANDARALVKDFDLLSAVQRRAIVELMRSGEASGASKNFMRHSANLIAYWRPGLWIMTDDRIRDDGFYYVFEDGTRLITVNPKAEGRAVTETLMHELAHDVWARADEDVRDSLYQLAVKGVDDARINDIRKRYRDELKARGEDVPEELLREEVVVGILGETIGREDLLSRFDGEGRFPVVRRILRTLSNMKKRFVGKDKYLYRKADDLFVKFTEVMAGQNNRAIGDYLTRYAIQQIPDTETKYVSIQVNDIVGDDIKDSDSWGRKARLFMRKKFNGVVLPLGKTKGAYIRKEGINEYTNPAKEIDTEIYREKMLASTELDNLLKTGKYLGWSRDDGRHPDVKRWLNYETVFLVKDSAGNKQVLRGIVRIKRIERGDCFYDITKIENITGGTIGQNILKYDAESASDVSTYSIAQNAEKSTALEKKVSENSGMTKRALSKRGEFVPPSAESVLSDAYHRGNAENEAIENAEKSAQNAIKNAEKLFSLEREKLEEQAAKKVRRAERAAQTAVKNAEKYAAVKVERAERTAARKVQRAEKSAENAIKNAEKKRVADKERVEREANEKANQNVKIHSKQLKKMVDDIMYLKHIVTHKKATDGGTVAAVLLEDPSLRAMVDFFAKRTTAYGLLHRSTREGIRAFLPWYTADNPILNDNAADDFFNSLGGAQNNVFGKFDAGMRGMMEALANGEGDISGQEIEYLQKVISGIGRLYVTYGKVKINGKWREGTALAEEHYHEQERLNKVLRARKDDDSKVQKGVRKIWRVVKESYLYGVVSPEAVLRDLENHSKDGVLSALYRDIRYGEAEAKKVRALILQPVAQFFAEHKDYRKKLQTETAIQFNGMKLTRAQAVGLWETSLREQAQQRMFEQGVRLVDYNDDTRAVHEIKVSKTELDNLYGQFSEEDRAYIKALEESFKLSTKYKLETDTEVFGYTNVVSGHYYPITTDENYFSRDVTDLRDSMGMMQVLNNLSFNKNTVKGAQAWLFVEDSLKVLERHAMGIGNYHGLYLPMQTFGQVYGCRFDPTGMVGKVKEGTDFLVESVVKKTSLREYYSKIWSKHGVSGSNLDKYLTKLFADVQGVVGEKTMVDKVMGWIQGNMITASFGLNLKVIATQLASYGSAYKNLDADVLTQALGMKNSKQDWVDEGERMDKYSRLTLARSFDGVGAAEGLVDKISEVGRLTTKGIDFTDRGVLIKLFEACQLQVEKDGRGALGGEDNLKAAGQMLDDLLLDTQTTSLKSDASSLMRSNNYLAKPFTMFRTESMKAFTNLYTTVSALVDHKRLADAGAQGYSELLKNDGKNIQRAAVSFMLSAAWVAAMTTVFTRIRKTVRGEEEDESIPVQYAGEVALGVAELFPVLSDFFGFMKDGYGVEAMPLTVINDSFTMLSGVGKLASSKSTQEEKARYLRQSVYTLGSLLGLPTRNAGRVALTTVSVVNRSAAYTINNASDTAPSYQSDLDRALAVGNGRLAATVISAWFERKKGGDTSEEVTAEILRLYGLKDGDGNNVLSMPKNVPSSLEGKERTAFEKIYSVADGEAVALIGSAAYGKLSDAGKAAALKVCYDMAWTRAAQATAVEVSESAVRLATAGAELPLLAQVAGFANAFHGENKKAQIVQYMVSLGIGMVERDRYLAALGYKV
jgi:hypothetical protein